MSTLGTNAITTADLKEALTSKGDAAKIYEVLEIASPIVKRGTWMPANMGKAHETFRQASTETATTRMDGRGVADTKTANVRVIDVATQYAASLSVDIETLKRQPNKEKYLSGQENRKIVAMKKDFEDNVLYGNATTNIEKINGLATRFNSISATRGEPGYQVVSAGGSTTLSSLYLIGMGDGGINFFYPEGTDAGVTRIVHPEERGVAPVDSTKHFYAYSIWNNWQVGMAVEDYRNSFLRIANIDTTALATYGSGADTSPDIIGIAVRAMEKLTLDPGLQYFWVASQTVSGWLKTQLLKTGNIYLTPAEAQAGMPGLKLNNIEVIKSDSVLNTESVVS